MTLAGRARTRGSGGREIAPVIRHIAEVVLIDSDSAIRKTSNSGFLDYDTLLPDVETTLLEEGTSSEPR
jgi:hypothetical protein